MTLDEFQKDNEKIFKELKQRMIELLTKGVAAGLDANIMVSIINIEIEKMQEQ
jgi:hypothetical protein